MKYIKQFLIILAFSFMGEILKLILPFPVPASIYGMALLFIALLTGVVKYADVKDTGTFLIEIMPVMFIPAGVGLITSWTNLKPILLPVSIITVVTIITVMLATGWVAQIIIRRKVK
jgi:holin-like protein